MNHLYYPIRRKSIIALLQCVPTKENVSLSLSLCVHEYVRMFAQHLCCSCKIGFFVINEMKFNQMRKENMFELAQKIFLGSFLLPIPVSTFQSETYVCVWIQRKIEQRKWFMFEMLICEIQTKSNKRPNRSNQTTDHPTDRLTNMLTYLLVFYAITLTLSLSPSLPLCHWMSSHFLRWFPSQCWG